VWHKGLGKLKNPVTPSGIRTANTCLLLHFNNCTSFFTTVFYHKKNCVPLIKNKTIIKEVGQSENLLRRYTYDKYCRSSSGIINVIRVFKALLEQNLAFPVPVVLLLPVI
jgi:hypothetical protein